MFYVSHRHVVVIVREDIEVVFWHILTCYFKYQQFSDVYHM